MPSVLVPQKPVMEQLRPDSDRKSNAAIIGDPWLAVSRYVRQHWQCNASKKV